MARILERSETRSFRERGEWFSRVVHNAPPHIKWLLLHSMGAEQIQDTLIGVKPATSAIDSGTASTLPRGFGHVTDDQLARDLEAVVRSTRGTPAIEAHKSQLLFPSSTAFTYRHRWLVNSALAREISVRHPDSFKAGVLPEGASQGELEGWIGRSLEASYDRVFGHLMGFDPKAVEEYARTSDLSTVRGRVFSVLQYSLMPALSGAGYDSLLGRLRASRTPAGKRVARKALQDRLDSLFEQAMPQALGQFGAREGLTERDFRRAWPAIRRQMSGEGRLVGGLYYGEPKPGGSRHVADYVGKRQASMIDFIVNNSVNGLRARYPEASLTRAD